ncbi:Variant surface glycoprotein [Trypanosoma congolense IL3000]|uniref:Variant surface glycoprotein n=1 Tax=Trypanosoma congolense (strain IL3000) TaxID=1068625 RepID=F9WE21_TRYCI|nr:Variant surface glycoprotein [Trypanosoma congolense IL3000]
MHIRRFYFLIFLIFLSFTRIIVSIVVILRCAEVIVMFGLIATRTNATGKMERSFNNDFDILCGVMSATVGLWENIAVNNEDFSEEVNVTDLGKKIEKIFFGPEWDGYSAGLWNFPEKFTRKNPKRSEVCKSNSDSTDMPSASKSLASTFLCLCTLGNEKKVCADRMLGTMVNGQTMIQAKVLKIYSKKIGVSTTKDGLKMNVAIARKAKHKESKETFKTKLKDLEDKLKNNTGIFVPKDMKCDGKTPCANVTESPTWLENLRQFKDIAESIKEKPKATPPVQKAPERASLPSPLSAQNQEPNSQTEHEPEPIMFQAPVETNKQETRKAPPPQTGPRPEPESENRVTNSSPNKAEKTEEHLPATESNETNWTFLTMPKWPLWAALLI